MDVSTLIVVLVGYGLFGAVIFGLWQQLKAKDNQLVTAWKAGYVIEPQVDPIPTVEEAQKDPYEEFSPMLKEYLLQWEGEEARAKRLKIAKSCKLQGMSEREILKKLETPSWMAT